MAVTKTLKDNVTGKTYNFTFDQEPTEQDLNDAMNHVEQSVQSEPAAQPEKEPGYLQNLAQPMIDTEAKLHARSEDFNKLPFIQKPARFVNDLAASTGDVLTGLAGTAVNLIPRKAQAAIGDVLEGPAQAAGGAAKAVGNNRSTSWNRVPLLARMLHLIARYLLLEIRQIGKYGDDIFIAHAYMYHIHRKEPAGLVRQVMVLLHLIQQPQYAGRVIAWLDINLPFFLLWQLLLQPFYNLLDLI